MSVGSVPNFSPGTAPKHLTKLLCEKDDRWLEEDGHCLGERLDNFWKRDFSGRSGQKQLCFDVSLIERATKGRRRHLSSLPPTATQVLHWEGPRLPLGASPGAQR